METIIIKLDPKKLHNPDLDLRYLVPERIEEYTDGKVCDNGYDYLSSQEMLIFLETEQAREDAASVITLIKAESFLENDLSQSAEIYISAEECAELENCERFYPL